MSIVEATCARVQQFGLKKIGLFGTRFTMQGRFYQDVFSRNAIELITSNDEEQDFIHEKYMGELLNDIFFARDARTDAKDCWRTAAASWH